MRIYKFNDTYIHTYMSATAKVMLTKVYDDLQPLIKPVTQKCAYFSAYSLCMYACMYVCMYVCNGLVYDVNIFQ